MFRIEITSLHEFHKFIRMIRGQEVTDEELKKLSDELGESADKLLAAEAAQNDTKV